MVSNVMIEVLEILYLEDVVWFEEFRIVLDKLDWLEDFYVGLCLSDNVVLLCDLICILLDFGIFFDMQLLLVEYEKILNILYSLIVFLLLVFGNCFSQNFVWIDFFFGSDDQNVGL